MGNLILCLLAASLSACGRSLPTSLDQPRGDQTKVQRIEAQLQLIDKSVLDFATLDEPVVLMFATYFCISCKEEAKNLAAFFAAKGALPKNARIITVLAGGDVARAERWAQINHVSWTMAADDDASVFQRLCPERLTPCVLTQNLNGAGIIKRIGGVPIEQLERETGPWLY